MKPEGEQTFACIDESGEHTNRLSMFYIWYDEPLNKQLKKNKHNH